MSWRTILVIGALALFSCNRGRLRIYVKNASWFHKAVYMNVKADGQALFSDSLRYDSSENGATALDETLGPGRHQLEVELPQLAIREIREVVVEGGDRPCYITLSDHTSSPGYQPGEVKLSINLPDKSPK